MKTILRTAVAAACGTAACTALAGNLPPITITAERFEAPLESAPVNVSVLTRQELQTYGARNVAEALELLPGVRIANLFGVTGSKARLDLGGFGGAGAQNTLVLVNGRRLNDVDLAGANLAAIPLTAVKRIEVVHGSAAVLYGDNATGGVINIVTRPEPGASVELGAGSFATRSIDAALGRESDAGRLGLTLSHTRSDGYRDDSAFDNTAASAEFARELDGAEVGVRLLAARESLELPGALPDPAYRDDPSQAGTSTIEEADERNASLELFYAGERLSAELAWRDRHQEAQVFGTTEADLTTLSFTPRVRHTAGRHRLTAGLDLYRSSLEVNADFSAFGAANEADVTRRSAALYLSDSIDLAPAWELTLGGRYQSVDFEVDSEDLMGDADGEDSRDDDLTAFDATLAHRHDGGGRSYLRYAESFRFPVLDEVWSYFSGSIGLLKPQTARHLEAGTSLPLGEVSRLSLTATAMDVTDEIGFDTATFSNENLDPTRHLGLDAVIETRPAERWEASLSYSLREATFRDGPHEGNDIPEVPRHAATLAVAWRPDVRQSIAASAVYTGERYFGNDFANEGKKLPGHGRLDLAYRYRANPWNVGVEIKNITDEKAADVGFYSPNPWDPDASPYFYYPLPERAVFVTVGAQWR